MVTVLYFSIINVLWLLNLCGVGGDASFAPRENLVTIIIDPNLVHTKALGSINDLNSCDIHGKLCKMGRPL